MNLPPELVPPNNSENQSHDLTVRQPTALSKTLASQVEEITDAESIDFGQIWRYIIRYKRLIVAITLFSLLGAYVFNMMLRPVYKSTATVWIKPHQNLVKFGFSGADYGARFNVRDFTSTQVELLNSSKLANRVISILNLKNNPELTGKTRQRNFQNSIENLFETISNLANSSNTSEVQIDANETRTDQALVLQRFSQRLDVSQGSKGQSNQVSITFSSFDPELAAEVANTVLDAYIQLEKEEKRTYQQDNIERLNGKLAQVQLKLEDSERRLNAYARKTGGGEFDLNSGESIVSRKLSLLNEEYLRAQSERIDLSSKQAKSTNSSKNAIMASILENDAINEMKRQRAELMSERRRLEGIYQPGYPKLQQVSVDLIEINKSIAAMSQEHVRALELQYEAAKERESLLAEELKKQSSTVLDFKDNAIEYNLLKRELESNKHLYSGLLERVKQSGVSSDLELSRVSVIDKAAVPLNKFTPNTMKNTSFAGFMGLVISLGIAGTLGLLDRRIRSPDDLAKKIKIYPNLSVLPIVEKANNSDDKIELLAYGDPKSGFAEAFRSLRTSLIYSLAGGLPQTMMITSSMPGEAKTTTICNMAFTLFQQNKQNRIVLVDLDLRKSRLHKIFNISQSPGVADFIVDVKSNLSFHKATGLVPEEIPSGNDTTQENLPDLDNVKLEKEIDSGLYILPAGTMTANPVELLDSNEFDQLLAILKRKFDIVLIDSAPVMGLSDALILSNKVDAVLMAVSTEVATIDSVNSAISRLEAVNARIVGTIMTKFNAREESYYYNNKYNYHYYSYDYGAEA